MKKSAVLLVFFVLLSSFTSSEAVKSFNLVGKWSGVDDKNAKGTFIFDEFGYATMVQNGQSMGGKDFEFGGGRASMKYILDESKSPVNFDIVIKDAASSQTMSMKFLMKVIDANTIVLASNFTDVRPTTFTKVNSITLKRE